MNVSPSSPTEPWAPANAEARRYENLLVLVLFMAFGFVFFDRQAVPFLAPFITDELDLSNTQLGTISGVLALTWALSGMFVGKLSDMLGIRKTILIMAVVLFSCFSAVSGLAGGFVSLLLIRALMGLAEGAVLPMAQSLMIESSQVHRRGLNMGLVQGSSAGLLGGIIAPPVVVAIATAFGWRVAFYVTILPGLLIALWIWKVVRERPPMSPLLSAERTRVETAGHKPTLREVLTERNVMLCMLIAVFYLTWFVLIITFAPLYMVEVKGFAPSTMANVMIFFGVAWVLWGAATPAISDRIGRKAALIGSTVLAALCPFVIVYVSSPVALAVLAVFTYTGLGCFTLFMATIPAETVPHGALATALGVVMGVGELAGGFIAPIIAGFASDAWGLQSAMFMAGGGAIIVVLLAFGLRETAPRVLLRRGFTHPEVPGAAEAGTTTGRGDATSEGRRR